MRELTSNSTFVKLQTDQKGSIISKRYIDALDRPTYQNVHKAYIHTYKVKHNGYTHNLI